MSENPTTNQAETQPTSEEIKQTQQTETIAQNENLDKNTQEESAKKETTEKKEEKKDADKSTKHIKNVNVKQCVFMLFMVMFGMLIAFVPATFGNKISFFFNYIPFISNAKSFDLTTTTLIIEGLTQLLGISGQITSILTAVFSIAPFVYFGILIFDFLFAIILIITRSQILRRICKIISIILAFAMLFACFTYLLYIVGFAGLIIMGTLPFNQISTAINTSGILIAIAFVFFCFVFFIKQLKWFAKLY